jgi:hypothetical protein
VPRRKTALPSSLPSAVQFLTWQISSPSRSRRSNLSLKRRASLVDTLIESLDVESSEAAPQAWFDEVRRRRRQVEDGSVQLLPGDELLSAIDKIV